MSLRRAVSGAPLLLLACGPAPSGSIGVAPKPPPPAAVEKPLVPESPARWVFHTPRASALRARMTVEGGVLFGGVGGERWLDRRDGSLPTASTALIPEPVVGLARGPGDKGVLVVGASGAVHRAKDPLGPFEGMNPGPPHARVATAGAHAVLAIADGALVRSADAGATWSPAPITGATGTLVDVASNESGLGLALYAPQRVFATQDDGATWTALPTPGVGARRLLVDANGDLVIEGLEASAVLRTSPLRLERMSGAPRPLALDTKSGTAPTLGLARAIAQGRAAILGDKYVEVIAEPDDPTHWRFAYGTFGAAIEPKKLSVSPCDRVWIGGTGKTLHLACDDRMTKKAIGLGSAPPPPGGDRAVVRLYRSDDEGKSWVEDGALGSRRADSGHLWVTPDGAVIVDGACKRPSTKECYDATPVIRNPKQKTFAKLGLPRGIQQIVAPTFDATGTNAYTLGRNATGTLKLLVSSDGGRDFRGVALPSLPAVDGKGTALVASHAEPGSITVDPVSGLVVATARVSGEWVVYTSADQGNTVQARRLPQRVDTVSFSGKRGFAWERSGVAYESSDGGATWVRLAAPAFPDMGASDRQLVCAELGCVLGDRAIRIGWGGTATSTPQSAEAKVVSASPLECTLEGEWKNLGAVSQPSVYDAETAAGVRWSAIKHDRAKGSVAVVVAKQGSKGLELKEVSLFGPAGPNVATAVVGQIEGAAAIRVPFKREAVKAPPKESKDSKDKKPALGAVIDGQTVDVEVAWYVAQTGTVRHATIKGAGPLDARDVFGASKDAATLGVGLLSIAQGGVHVRPFATRAEVPLFFVSDGGKVERFPWPSVPSKDASGSAFTLRTDAIRAAGRSVVLGVVGAQLWTAWANESGTSWDARTWGLWPDLEPSRNDATWDFTYLGATAGKNAVLGTGGRPAIVVQVPGGGGIAPSAWAVPLRGVEADPGEVLPFATQKTLGDSEAACAPADSGGRVVAPFSVGTRHPMVVSGEAQDLLLATTFAALRGDAKNACVIAYEARALTAKKSDESGPLALVPWADKEHSALFRTASSGDLSVRSMSCTPAKDLPAGLGGAEGFSAEP